MQPHHHRESAETSRLRRPNVHNEAVLVHDARRPQRAEDALADIAVLRTLRAERQSFAHAAPWDGRRRRLEPAALGGTAIGHALEDADAVDDRAGYAACGRWDTLCGYRCGRHERRYGRRRAKLQDGSPARAHIMHHCPLIA